MIYNEDQDGAAEDRGTTERKPLRLPPSQPGRTSDQKEKPKTKVYGGVHRERIVSEDGTIKVVAA